ncbi:MAG: TIGR02710 family CRISPR-associated CARF protein [Chloroflexi bacterium]|nr:TIGR02710 family CRISPR-associated CARF protein [Chloroflexota bacterium]
MLEVAAYTLLVSTVGGTAAPIVKSLLDARPEMVIFVSSAESRPTVAAALAEAAEQGLALRPSQWRIVETPDSQDLGKCVQRLRRLDEETERWQERGDGFRVVVDFTGGTKCMSAALALAARRWRCVFAYVGGTERTKEGVGLVVSGSETVLNAQNPWDALGYQAAEDATLLCDQGQYAGAVQLLEAAQRRSGPEERRTLATLAEAAKGYDAWERFRHKDALTSLTNARKNANDLRALLGSERADVLLQHMETNCAWLANLGPATPPTRPRILDLLANACRRGAEQRFDDAVARLYRSLEALAQLALLPHGVADTGAVPLDAVPAPLRQEWESRARNGMLLLGLQDDYRLLEALRDPLAAQFGALGLDDRSRSPLQARNNSILAHGFDTVGPRVFAQLRDAALRLAGVAEATLPAFPKLSGAAVN